MADAGAGIEGADPLVDRAVRLFTFLGRAQELKNTPVLDIGSYQREGAVHWLAQAPAHPAVRSCLRGELADEAAPLLTIERVARLAPPEPVSDEHHAWLATPIDDPAQEPSLREHLIVEADDADPADDGDENGVPTQRVDLADRPDLIEAHADYLLTWRTWAAQVREDEPVRAYYAELFSSYLAATSRTEELELVVGTSLLAWQPPGHGRSRRHLLAAPVRVTFDEGSGQLSVLPDSQAAQDRVTVELDMLDPSLVTQPERINQIRESARTEPAHPLNREVMGELGRRLAHLLAADAHFRDDDEADTGVTATPVVTFAPALILRRRSRQGVVQIYRTMINQITETKSVPPGIRPLLDPDRVPPAREEVENREGALVRVDEEPFLPLPVNERQLQILRRVDSTAQTLIQGPPGTGKTHTAAVLISHLLAQGKRVLVTAHTDRALKEVRGKLPEAIRPLAVSVVGSSREDMSDLRTAIEGIAATAADHDESQAAATIARCLAQIDDLRRRRARLYQQLREAREREIRSHDVAGYHGTLAAIARRRLDEEPDLGWIGEFTGAIAGEPPLRDADLLRWLTLLRDEELNADEPDAAAVLVPLSDLPEPNGFADLVATEQRSRRQAEQYRRLHSHPAFAPFRTLAGQERDDLAERLRQVDVRLRRLASRHERWVFDALGELRAGRLPLWASRQNEIDRQIAEVGEVLSALHSAVQVTGEDPGLLVPAAEQLREYLNGGKRIKLGPDGLPKLGTFTARAVKDAEAFFGRVRVNGLVPLAAEAVEAFLTWVKADHLLDELDRAWPATTVIPEEDTPQERLHWHVTELEVLRQVVALGGEIGELSAEMHRLGLPDADWFDPRTLEAYRAIPEAVHADDAAAAARAPLVALEQRVAGWIRQPGSALIAQRLQEAIQRRLDIPYTTAHQRLTRLHQVRELVGERERRRTALSAAAPRLAEAVTADPTAGHWESRLGRFAEAWAWAAAGSWLTALESVDVNALQAAVNDVEDTLRGKVEELAATRAWTHAVAPQRLTRRSRAFLEQYAALVRRFGKGTGIHRERQKLEIKAALDQCRGAVPIWIMPIYRIAEQLRVEPDMFDVVIVDEASQAGLEATFLLYLAPRIVVIGDDKQVSPSAVGTDRQQLHDLANQYLYDDEFHSTWKDPQRSLFDEARMRFSGMLTLIEHRRCVPEIIGFSNRVAYEPAGVRLVPVRQFGADRLEPIQTVFVSDGYERGGGTSRTNPAEVDAIVEQIEKCLVDPRYDGLTMGVISLLGPTQAKAIEKRLLERVKPEEWQARELRCGDAAAFQGSERDVTFLSMVAAPGPDRRVTALTAETYVQRYNVAASRAKDQLWVFHSIDPATLSNPEDMRFQLLDYCYGVRGCGQEGDATLLAAVPDETLVPPFDSLFEQRVFNRIVDRGYTVQPQFDALGYRIDLVVIGAKARLAVECDGDFWHGPEAYQQDMGRQRELERCGWSFFRVLESDFVLDPAAALAGLWERLAELEIFPSGWVDPEVTPSAPTEPNIPVPEGKSAEPGPLTESPAQPGPVAASISRVEPRQPAEPQPLADPPTDPHLPVVAHPFPEPSAVVEPSPALGARLSVQPSPLTEPDPPVEPRLPAGPHSLTEPISFVEPSSSTEPGLLVEPSPSNEPSALAAPTATVETTSTESSLPEAPAVSSSSRGAEHRPHDSSAVARVDRSAVYQHFQGVTTPALAATDSQLIDGLVEIVRVEGPIVGSRLYRVYREASGQGRTGSQIQEALNRAIKIALRRGLLVGASPLSETGIDRTYRTPDQPEVVIRPIGPRAFDEIPPTELAAVMTEIAGQIGWTEPLAVFRATHAHYGGRKLRESTRLRLMRVSSRLVEHRP